MKKKETQEYANEPCGCLGFVQRRLEEKIVFSEGKLKIFMICRNCNSYWEEPLKKITLTTK